MKIFLITIFILIMSSRSGIVDKTVLRGISSTLNFLISSARNTANEYRHDFSFKSHEEKINYIIKKNCSINALTGTLTSIIPILNVASLPASLGLQLRTALIVSIVNNPDENDDNVIQFILSILVGDVGTELLKQGAGSLLRYIPLVGQVAAFATDYAGCYLIAKAANHYIIENK
jgi:hypothetical protein